MSNTASPAAGSAPAAPAAPPAPPANQLDLAGLTVQQLNELQAQPGANEPPVITPKPGPTPTVIAPTPDPAQPPPEPTPPVAPPVAPPAEPLPPEEIPDPAKVGRFRLEATNFKDAEVMRLIAKSQAEARQDPGLRPLTLPEAIERVYGRQGPATPPPPETDQPADPMTRVRTATETRAKALTEIDAKLDKAADEMDMKAIVALNRERQQAVLELDRLNRQAAALERNGKQQQMQEATNLFRQREREYTRETMKAYPVLADKASAERAEFDRFVMQKADDPDFAAVFDSPSWPLIVAREFDVARGLKRGTTASTATTPAPTPAHNGTPVTPQSVVPAAVRATSATVITPGADGGHGATPSAEQLVQDIAAGRFTMKQLDELMAKGAVRA